MRMSFGDFTFDSDSRELRRGAESVRLSPKALQLLEILVLNRLKAISKAELQNRLWPDTFVVEKNLANLISEIREALGEDRSAPRFIRTVPRYGYAFRELGTEIIESRNRPSRLTWTRHRAALAAAAVVIALGYGGWSLLKTPRTTDDERVMLVVLPFQNLTGDPDEQYLCDGLTEEMIARLGGADPSRLGVIARTSAMHFTTGIGKKLNSTTRERSLSTRQ